MYVARQGDFTRETVKWSDRETVSIVVGVMEKTRDHRTRHHVFYRLQIDLQSANGVDVRLLVLLPRRHLKSSIHH